MQTRSATTRRWSISSNELQLQRQKDCLYQSLPENLGVGQSAIFQLDQDLSYIETRYAPSKELSVLSRMDYQEPRLMVTLGLKGQSRFADSSGDELVFREGYTAITTIQSSIGERQYQAHKPTLQLRFSLSKNWLNKYFGESKTAQLLGKSGTQLLNCQPISPQAIYAAQQLLSYNTSRETNRIFMHGQAMSLLAFELIPLSEDKRRNSTRLDQQDAAIAKSARDILLREFRNPPSVEELSKRVGTNQFKLKQLFHHFFSNTPYGLLLEIRMNNAYRLLESTRCQVSVAADLVGYSHASNFSVAFIRYFGFSPKVLQKILNN
ncbi:AraC family transcriptional regulator [Methylobacter sp.]|uniref:helix-turn-helix transcriptional regulator n=1 Tax=Methylobacter sp. TaxID=2051955 RepID=UPI00120B4BB2|nr:AraC family transcriptional regulator [Methylobacter sp.]TAK62898.1 MAG: AraC family transcriptional regulator [Methylobacter sp.]